MKRYVLRAESRPAQARAEKRAQDKDWHPDSLLASSFLTLLVTLSAAERKKKRLRLRQPPSSAAPHKAESVEGHHHLCQLTEGPSRVAAGAIQGKIEHCV